MHVKSAEWIPVILATDTSSRRLGLTLARGSEPIASLTCSRFEPHSKTFFDHLAAILSLSRLSIEEVDLLAAVTGPGSFTGLRVGLAALKGLASTLEKPLMGVNLLDLLALDPGLAGDILVIIEAGRHEIFCGRRRVSPSGLVETEGPDQYGPPSEALRQVLRNDPPRTLLITGNAARHYRRDLEELAGEWGSRCTFETTADPRANHWQVLPERGETTLLLARYAERLFLSGSLPACHPYYIRPSDAELNWEK